MTSHTALVFLWRLVRTVRNWPIYFWNRFGWIHRTNVDYKLWNGLTITSRPFAIDRCALNDVWFDLSYEPNAYGIPFNWGECNTIIDIGANIGTFTLYAATHALTAKILAYEPEQQTAKILRHNVSQNNLEDRIAVQEMALGATKGTITLHISDHGSGGHSIYHYTEKSHAISVPVTTLQHVFDEHSIATCDFLKMDCEGAEYDILYNLPEDYWPRIRFIALEYHYFSDNKRHTPKALQSYLKQHGFVIVLHKKSLLFAYRMPTQA